MSRYFHDCAESDIEQYSITQRYFTIFFHSWNYARYILAIREIRQIAGEGIPQRQTCMPAQKWKAVFQDQFEKQTMIRYDWGRSGLRWRTMSLKQWAEWIVTHLYSREWLSSRRRCLLRDKNVILGNDCHTTANSTDSMETTWDTY